MHYLFEIYTIVQVIISIAKNIKQTWTEMFVINYHEAIEVIYEIEKYIWETAPHPLIFLIYFVLLLFVKTALYSVLS